MQTEAAEQILNEELLFNNSRQTILSINEHASNGASKMRNENLKIKCQARKIIKHLEQS